MVRSGCSQQPFQFAQLPGGLGPGQQQHGRKRVGRIRRQRFAARGGYFYSGQRSVFCAGSGSRWDGTESHLLTRRERAPSLRRPIPVFHTWTATFKIDFSQRSPMLHRPRTIATIVATAAAVLGFMPAVAPAERQIRATRCCWVCGSTTMGCSQHHRARLITRSQDNYNIKLTDNRSFLFAQNDGNTMWDISSNLWSRYDWVFNSSSFPAPYLSKHSKSFFSCRSGPCCVRDTQSYDR